MKSMFLETTFIGYLVARYRQELLSAEDLAAVRREQADIAAHGWLPPNGTHKGNAASISLVN